jgi:hypothetical protein
VGDAALLVPAVDSPTLSCIRLNRDRVTDAGLIAMPRNGALTSLDLVVNRTVADADFSRLPPAAHCSRASTSATADSFTDAALIAVAQSCSLLESINIFQYTSFTDDALIAIVVHATTCVNQTSQTPCPLTRDWDLPPGAARY